MNPIQCKCTECGQLFVITEKSCKEDNLTMSDGEKLKLEYFSCPACRKVFPVYLENAYVKQLKDARTAVQDKINKLVNKGAVTPSTAEKLERYSKKVSKYTIEVQKLQKVLKDRYNGEFYLLDPATNK